MDRTVLRLSDAFENKEKDAKACLECEVTVLNINHGHNHELLERCRRLGEYTEFVSRVREYLDKEDSVEKAVRIAMKSCLEQGILVDVLSRNRTEVLEVLLTEYNEEKTRKYLYREAVEIGLEQGLEQGIKVLLETYQELGVSKEDAIIRLKQKFALDELKAKGYLEQYWNS